MTAPPANAEEYEAAIDNLHEVRMAGTINDFDGDGDATEGVVRRADGARRTCSTARSAPTRTPPRRTGRARRCPPRRSRTRRPRYPYFFVDPNDNGVVDPGEKTGYNAWTARLLRAAYDYQYAQKDPGAFAHNAKYLIEVLYDAIADLQLGHSRSPASPLSSATTAGTSTRRRRPTGNWDEDTDHLVDPSCSRCHSVEGFLFRVKYGIDQTIPAALSSGHDLRDAATRPERSSRRSRPDAGAPLRQVGRVPVPDDRDVDADRQRHDRERRRGHGRGGRFLPLHDVPPGPRVDAHGRRRQPDSGVTTFTLSFRNVHYLPAGGTQYGNKAAVAYQYTGKTYAPPWNHGVAYAGTLSAAGGREGALRVLPPAGRQPQLRARGDGDLPDCHGNVTLDELTPVGRPEDNWDSDAGTKPKAEVAVFAARLLRGDPDLLRRRGRRPDAAGRSELHGLQRCGVSRTGSRTPTRTAVVDNGEGGTRTR